MTTAHRNPIFGALAVIAPLVGFFFWWRIASDKAASTGDYTGLGVPLAIFLYFAPCVLLSTIFGIVSLVRRETPKQVAWLGLALAWTPVIFGYIRARLHV